MINPRRTALYIAIGAMTFAAGEAAAGCKYIPYPPGSYVCASYIKGSTVCEVATGNLTNLVSATCKATGVNFIDGAEGAPWTDGAYCASGSPPPGVCESAPSLRTSSAGTGSASKAAAKAKKAKKAKECKSKHGGKHLGKHVGHDDSCEIILPGDPYLSTVVDIANDCVSDGSGGGTCQVTILPPEGSTCSDGQPPTAFTATEMLAVVEACADDGYGNISCAKIYDYCTLDPLAPLGTEYTCVEISGLEPYEDQGTTCDNYFSGSYFTYAPDDPQCGQVRTCIID